MDVNLGDTLFNSTDRLGITDFPLSLRIPYGLAWYLPHTHSAPASKCLVYACYRCNIKYVLAQKIDYELQACFLAGSMGWLLPGELLLLTAFLRGSPQSVWQLHVPVS